MLDRIIDPNEGDENELDELDEIGEDLQEGYLADLKPIHFVDPGLALVVIQLKANDIISKDEARDYLGLDLEA